MDNSSAGFLSTLEETRFTHTLTIGNNLEFPVNLMCIFFFLNVGE